MKEVFLLRRRRKTHLLAGNIGGGVFRNERAPLPYLGEEGVAVSIPWFRHGIAVSIPWIRHAM